MSGRNISLVALTIAGLAISVAIGLVVFTTTRKATPIPTPPQTLQLGNQGLPRDTSETTYPTQVGPDWETYENTKYGYSLKYPPFWATIINITPQSKNETLATATSLDIFDSAAQKSYPEGVMTIQYLSTAPSSPVSFSRSEITLNSIKAQKFEGDEDDLHKEIYLIPSGGGVIEIDIRFAPGDAIRQTFAAMLSTLQLIN